MLSLLPGHLTPPALALSSRHLQRLAAASQKWTNLFCPLLLVEHQQQSRTFAKDPKSNRLQPLEEHSQTHLIHGKMTNGTFERRPSSGSSSGEDHKRPFMIGVAGGTASGKVNNNVFQGHIDQKPIF